MKLTKDIREQFIKDVMAEVPCVDYLQLIEDVAQKDFYNSFPPEIKAIWDNPKLRKDYLPAKSAYQSCDAHCLEEDTTGYIYVYNGLTQELSKAAKDEIAELRQQWNVQVLRRKALREKLSSVVNGVKTTQRLYEVLPEFEHHIPKEKEPTAMLPIASDVVASFMKAGWKPVTASA